MSGCMRWICFILAVSTSLPLPGQSREERWTQDVNFLANQFKTVHPKPFARVSQTEFDQAVRDLISRIGQSADYELVLGMNRIAAMVNDAHSYVYPFQGGSGLRQLPIRVRWFKDGYYVTAAHANHVAALGKRVTAINGVAMDEVHRRLRSFIPAENDSWAIRQAEALLVSPEVLRVAQVIENVNAPVPFQFEGLTENVQPAPGPISVFPRKAAPNPPLHVRNPSLTYWFDYLPESKTLYLQYNQCLQDAALPMAEFARQFVELVSAREVERLAIDLRYNEGGDSSILFELLNTVQPLFESGRFRPRGIYGLIGRQTFSSGMNNAVDLKSSGLVRLVGEPTGGSPNGPGQVRGFVLPNSRLAGQVSTREFALPGYEGKDTVEPDVAVPLTIEDWANERDPVLEWVTKN